MLNDIFSKILVSYNLDNDVSTVSLITYFKHIHNKIQRQIPYAISLTLSHPYAHALHIKNEKLFTFSSPLLSSSPTKKNAK